MSAPINPLKVENTELKFLILRYCRIYGTQLKYALPNAMPARTLGLFSSLPLSILEMSVEGYPLFNESKLVSPCIKYRNRIYFIIIATNEPFYYFVVEFSLC